MGYLFENMEKMDIQQERRKFRKLAMSCRAYISRKFLFYCSRKRHISSSIYLHPYDTVSHRRYHGP